MRRERGKERKKERKDDKIAKKEGDSVANTSLAYIKKMKLTSTKWIVLRMAAGKIQRQEEEAQEGKGVKVRERDFLTLPFVVIFVAFFLPFLIYQRRGHRSCEPLSRIPHIALLVT